MKVVTFKVDEVLLRRLDEFCLKAGKSRSEVIREALASYLFREREERRVWRVRRVVLR